MGKKYYLVINGRCKPYTVFETWPECKKNVLGFSNSKYIGFNSREELDDYLQKYKLENKSNIRPEKKSITKKEADEQYKAVKEIQKKSGASLGEANAEYVLQSYGIKYTPQYEIHISGSRHLFDFAIYNGRKIVAFIEFDGRQHFEPVPQFGGAEALQNRQHRDSIKDAYCETFRIKMVRIPYNSSNRTNSIIKKEILPLLKKYSDPSIIKGNEYKLTCKEFSEIIGWDVDFDLLSSWTVKKNLDRRKKDFKKKTKIISVSARNGYFIVVMNNKTYIIKR